MYKKKKTYELEVHFGLLVLVVIMLCLNIFSNYVIYNAKNIVKDDYSSELYKSSLAVSRYIQNNQLTSISATEKKQFLSKYKLDDIKLIQTMQKDFNNTTNLQWLIELLSDLPQEQIPKLTRVILTSDFYTLTRGDDNQYYYVVPVLSGKYKNILILSKDFDKLAYLDDASDTIVIISLVTLFAITLIYILLYRFILSPFRKLKEKAKSAGRIIPSENYEVGSVIDEYEIIIKELKEKESELLKLHQEATNRADSYEQFNVYLLGSMQAGIITIDNSGKILTINKSAETICNIESDIFLKNDYTTLSFLPENLKNKIDETLTSKIFHSYQEYEFMNPPIRVGITISPVCDSETHQVGASILINDISEIKKLQIELEKNRQMSALGEMSAGLAHQLRNSLGAIVGYNQLVKKRLVQNNIETTTVDSMATELKESEHLIKRFLNFTKPFDFTTESELIVPFVENLIENLSIRSDFKQITIKLNNQLPNEIQAGIDQLLLKQALTNIIENSKNAYNDSSGVIEIGLESDVNNTCIISVKDRAGGIEKENINKIFTPFYSTNPSGTGLGLPLAQKIIALHNGHLQVESVVGEGTIFKIIIPLEDKTLKDKSALTH